MFLETSAKTAYNVVEAFNLSAQCILNNIQKSGEDLTLNPNINLNNDKKNNAEDNKKSCC